jgi:general secretion pathway protein K
MRLGAGPAEAERVAAAIADWRTPGQVPRPNGAKAAQYRAEGRDYGPPGAPFESLDELQDVRGVTPPMLRALLPYLTLYADRDPIPALAPPVVAAALGDLGVRGGRGPADAGDVFRITAAAAGRDGVLVVRSATVKLGLSNNGKAWRVLSWETTPAPPGT